MLYHIKKLFIYRKKVEKRGVKQSNNEELYEKDRNDSSSLKLKPNRALIIEEVQHLMREKAKVLHAKDLRPSNESLNNKHLEINRKLDSFSELHKKI